MISLRKRLKRLVYGSRGWFPYFGERIYFPKRSMIFELACVQGIFERENLQLLRGAILPNTWYFDIGANIGLLSAPLLRHDPSLNIVSVEASPNTAPFLQRTARESASKSRWHVVAEAVGATIGSVDFHLAEAAQGAFDGMRATGRTQSRGTAKVPLVTLDALWKRFGSPPISLVKIDVEGAEHAVLKGAAECLQQQRPTVLLEWNSENLQAYGTLPDTMLTAAEEMGYEVLIAPQLAHVRGAQQLRLAMSCGETFVLLPR
jgi:FkbM family methyltransferase